MAKKTKKSGRTVEEDGPIEEIAPTVEPEPPIAEPDAAAIAMPKLEQAPLSPYASNPVKINVGLVPVTYYVPWHLLGTTNWSTVPPGGEIHLPTISAETGHTLVHYLYTGTYQTLDSEISGTTQRPKLATKQALLVYRASVTHKLDGLETLAKQQIEEHSASMDLMKILDIFRTELPKKTEPSDWIQAFLKAKAQKAFDKDHTVFANDAFCASLCKRSKLNDHVVHHVVKLLSEKLTQALAEKGNIAEEPDDFPRPLQAREEFVADDFSRRQVEEAEPAALALYEHIDNDASLAVGVDEEPATIDEPEACKDAPVPVPESEVYYEVPIPAPEPEPYYEDSNNAVESGPLAPEPPTSVWVEYVPPPRPKKETATAKKQRLIQERKDKEKWDKEQRERIEEEVKKALCEEPQPTSDAGWGFSGRHVGSDSSWEHAAPVAVDEAELIFEDSIPVEPIPELLDEVPPPEEAVPSPEEASPPPEEASPPPEEAIPPPEEPIPVEEPKLHETSSLCPQRYTHIMEGDLWKTCKPCRTMLMGIRSKVSFEKDV